MINTSLASALMRLIIFRQIVACKQIRDGACLDVHARGRLPFQNVAWHGSVLLGASLHWAAVANLIAYSLG